MLFIPPSIPTSSSYKITSNIESSGVSQAVMEKITSIESLRYAFWSQLAQLMQQSKKLQNGKFWSEKKAYLYETLNLLDIYSEHGKVYCALKYWSVLGQLLSHSPFDFTFEGSGETVATVEIIMSRYAYAFAQLSCQEERFSQLLIYKANQTALADKITEIMQDVEDAAIRMAKFNQSKKEIWAALDNATLQKYSNVMELNFMLVQPFYLIFEVVFATLVVFKILLTNSDSVKHCSLVSSTVAYGLSKIEAIQHAFLKYPNSFQSYVLKWSEDATELLKFQRLFSCYLLNKAQETSSDGTRTKVFEQIYHENFILGQELMVYLGRENAGIEYEYFQDKYRTAILKDISKYGHLEADIKPEYKKISIADILYDQKQSAVPDTVRNMINAKSGIN